MPTCTGLHVCLACHAMHLVLLQWDHLDQDAQGKVPARTQKGGVGGEEEEEEDIEQLLARPV